MKAVRLPTLRWSPWRHHDFAPDWFCYLHHWREATHPSDHKVEVWRSRVDGRMVYEAYVMAGAYGETSYLRQEFAHAGEARAAAERAVQRAIEEGAIEV